MTQGFCDLMRLSYTPDLVIEDPFPLLITKPQSIDQVLLHFDWSWEVIHHGIGYLIETWVISFFLAAFQRISHISTACSPFSIFVK